MSKRPQPTKLISALQRLANLVNDPDAFAIDADLESSCRELFTLLETVTAEQPPFKVVDSEVDSAARYGRLLAWLRKCPGFACADLEVVDTRPGVARGVVLKEAVDAKAPVMTVPTGAMLTSATPFQMPDLGPLLGPAIPAAAMPSVRMVLALMVEHAKALTAGAAGATADVPEGVNIWDRAYSFEPIVPEEEDEEADHDEEACGDEGHGHSHSGGGGHGHGGHGHSHGGKPCGGHGHSHGAPKPKPKPSGGGHGHSHGGKPCGGHGHSHGPAVDFDALVRPLAVETAHPWGSAFRAYIATLPSSPASCLSFTLADIKELAGTPLQAEVAGHLRNSVKSYLSLYNLFCGGNPLIKGFQGHYTWAHYKWAMAIASSRQNRIPSPRLSLEQLEAAHGAESFEMALIPLYDFVNHEEAPQITSFLVPLKSHGTMGLVLETHRAFAAGEELLMMYGGRTNAHLLQYMGFVAKENPHDVAYVEAQMDGLDADPLFKIRANVLRSLMITPDHNAQRWIKRSSRVANMGRMLSRMPPVEAQNMAERFLWGLPFTFTVSADGEVSHDLVTFMRVALLDGKAEAADAMKKAQAAVAGLEAKRAEALQKMKDRIAAGTDEDAEDDEDEEAGYKLELPLLNDSNERLVWGSIIANLHLALDNLDDEETKAKAAAIEKKGGKKGKKSSSGGAAAAAPAPAPAPLDWDALTPAQRYRQGQRSILLRAIQNAEATLVGMGPAPAEAKPEGEAVKVVE